jgi:hypothetical protein
MPCPKLSMKYFGSYKILDRICIKLELPTHSQVHRVFHVSQLKPYNADYAPKFKPLQFPPQLDLKDMVPEIVLDRRLSKQAYTKLFLKS